MNFTALGWRYVGGENLFLPKGDRRWVVSLVAEEVLRHGKCPGRELEGIISHYSFLCLARRPAVSVLPSCYAFIERSYVEASPLWGSIQRELRWVRGLLPLLQRSLSMPWADATFVSDASGWGGGVAYKRVSPVRAAEVGRISERWRYKTPSDLGAALPRRHVFGAEGDDTHVPGTPFSPPRFDAIDQAFDWSLSKSALQGPLLPAPVQLEVDQTFPGGPDDVKWGRMDTSNPEKVERQGGAGGPGGACGAPLNSSGS